MFMVDQKNNSSRKITNFSNYTRHLTQKKILFDFLNENVEFSLLFFFLKEIGISSWLVVSRTVYAKVNMNMPHGYHRLGLEFDF